MTQKNIHQSELFEELKTIKLMNSKSTKLEIINFGAVLYSLKFLRDNGNYLNVVVSPKKPEDFLSHSYRTHNKCFGASIGRYAGRISGGNLSLDNNQYQLSSKDGVHLHGGNLGFAYKFWKIEEITKNFNPSVRLSYLSKDGEEGYPGNLRVSVTYTLTEEDEVKIKYTATTDKDTVVNLTNHAYFNLNGAGDVKGHLLKINAEEVLDVDEKLIPSGRLNEVAGTDKDFRDLRPIGDNLLDDCFVLRKTGEELVVLKGSESRISLKVETDQPAVVVYVPENLPADFEYQTEIASGKPSICLETQNFPDAPNHENFPTSVLKPGEEYTNKIIWKFNSF